MAELIDKKVLDNEHIYVIETDGSIHKMIFCGDCDWEERPVTTLAEIRAKAIDEFAEKLKESLLKNYRHFITTDTDGFEWLTTDAVTTHIDKVAEQLKEE